MASSDIPLLILPPGPVNQFTLNPILLDVSGFVDQRYDNDIAQNSQAVYKQEERHKTQQ